MISEDTREALEMSVVPIMLGDGFKARRLAMKMLFKYGVQGVICDARRSAWRFLIPFGSFFETDCRDEPELFGAELERIVSCSDGGLLILSPCKSDFAALVDGARKEIETRFILAEPCELIDKIFPNE